MIQLIIDQKEIESPRESTILEVARKHGIDIPTLCYHEALEPFGVCRLCIVEVAGSLRRGLRISCVQNVMAGLIVDTQSDSLFSSCYWQDLRTPTSSLIWPPDTVSMNPGFIPATPMITVFDAACA